ncbi:meiotic recombination protein SPO11-2 [Oopsacas minuta]|uniref:DNA topoisomerase (ATP-hydrolyzing) n=1 Tax=Oopsacas minuta TaxID=111878 RepID=A0AAV7KFX1_9METZ|nr:meiotic recombination protein SPO11-2 [Oopsacas minuta]
MQNIVTANYLLKGEILNKIELLALSIARELSQEKDLPLSLLVNSKDNYILNDSGILHCGKKKKEKTLLSKKSKQLSNKYVKLWIVINYIHMVVTSDKEVTLREAYYFLKTFFSNQSEFSKRLVDIMGLFECQRECLGIIGSSSGAIAGLVQWIEPGLYCDCSNTSLGGKRLPGSVKEVKFKSLGARYVIVVEKDAIFNLLCEDSIWEKIPCVIFTGCGYPSLGARKILKKLEEDLSVPFLGLFDYNPHGVRILFTYRFGSFGLGLETAHYTINIKWMGVHFSDVTDSKAIPQHVWMEWNKSDHSIHKSNIKTFLPKLSRPAQDELTKMGEVKRKLEIEAIEYLTSIPKYILDKILHNDYIQLIDM